jgi:hypothetical protein
MKPTITDPQQLRRQSNKILGKNQNTKAKIQTQRLEAGSNQGNVSNEGSNGRRYRLER